MASLSRRAAGPTRRRALCAIALSALCVALVPVATTGAAGAVAAPPSDPASLVDPFVGTGSGPVQPGSIDTFPGASLPFGMIQWSPDTSPDRTDGGGYSYADHRMIGLSLTHLSGPGCPYFGDVPVLPVTGPVPAAPWSSTAAFSHGSERASPGSYSVDVGSPSTSVSVAVTDRAGTGHFVFGTGKEGNLLFKASDSADGSRHSTLEVVGDDEVEGSVTGGAFCTTSGPYTVYFVARFDRPFSAHGTWHGSALARGGDRCAGSSASACGGWVTFSTRRTHSVDMQVAISYVSLAGAAANLSAEHPGWDVSVVAHAATNTWNQVLGRIGVSGGSGDRERTFYTALYHSLLSPNIFSDDDGKYLGFDHAVHRAAGFIQYTDFSEWDIYRSQFPLVAMLFPHVASAMVRSLLDDAAQSGWLPRWPVAASDAGQTDGDPVDLIIAEAYALGARGFDAKQALADMEKGASQERSGLIQERQDGQKYLDQGYVVGSTEDLTSFGYTLGTSETLEYALDDFGINRLAAALGQKAAASAAGQRAQNWQNVFDPGTGYMGARLTSGAFVPGPAFQPTHVTNQGQVGFEEGNAIQYSWAAPQNLSSLVALMGGDAAATSKLNTFFTQLNASRYAPYYWAGNEPDLEAPWEYDFTGAPWRTEQVVRQILDTQYALTPAGEPGNDDLGELSSWYVWGSLGLYPVTPATSTLVLAAPAFPQVSIHLGNGHLLRITSRGPSGGYVHSATLALGSHPAAGWYQAWLPPSVIFSGADLTLVTRRAPDRSWGASPVEAPPSYPRFAAPAVGFTTPVGEVAVSPGASTPATLGLQAAGHAAATVQWSVLPTPGATVEPSSGTLDLPATPAGAPTARVTVPITVTGGATGNWAVGFILTAGTGVKLPPLALAVAVS